MFLGICCFCHKNSYPSFKTEWRRGAGEWAGPVLAPLDTVPTLLRSPHGNWPCEPFTSNTVYHSSPSQDDGLLRDTIVHLFSINGSLADARCDGNTVTGAPTDHATVLPGDGLPGASRSGTRRRKPNSFSGPRFPLLTQVNSQDETG